MKRMFNISIIQDIISLDALEITSELNTMILLESTHGEKFKKKILQNGFTITTSETLTSNNGKPMPQMDTIKLHMKSATSKCNTLGNHG